MPELQAIVRQPLAHTRTAIEAALKAEGFGVLTEIDVQAVFETKLDAVHEGHRILGVCNPVIAKRALDLDRDIALLLPCTVTLREVDGGTEVKILDPQLAFSLAAPATRTPLEPLAREVGEMLARALAALEVA